MLSERSRRVVELAGAEARQLGHAAVGDDHLLLGLLHERRGLAARVLRRGGVTLDVSRAAIAAARRGPHEQTEHPPLELSGKRALQLALHVAFERNDGPIRAAYLLLGILEVDGAAASVVGAQRAMPAELIAAANRRLPAIDRDRGRALLEDRLAAVAAQLLAASRRAEVSEIVSRSADRDSAAAGVAALLGVSLEQATAVLEMALGMATEANLEALDTERRALERRIGALRAGPAP